MKEIIVTVQIRVFGPNDAPLTVEQAENYVAMCVEETMLEVPFTETGARDLAAIEKKVKLEGMVIGDYKV